MYLASVFTDHMVVQRQMPIPVWGWADTGRQVTVALATQRKSMIVPDGGYWQVCFDPIDAAEPLTLAVSDGETTIECNDIVVGEVWLCAGQSNMQWDVRRNDNAEQNIAGAVDPAIRLLDPTVWYASEPQVHLDAAWSVCSPDTVPDFSAVGYLFGRNLRDQLDVPIGLIDISLGGSRVETWISRTALEADDMLKPQLDRYDFDRAHYILARQSHDISGVSPKPQGSPEESKKHVSGLFNAMIAPLIPHAMRGVIWYQGEANGNCGYHYRRMFTAMIRDWRRQWARGDFPFLFVQEPNFDLGPDGEYQWAELRESQAEALKLPGTAMAVTIDVGDPDDLHPSNKQPVADRLAALALCDVYGRDVPARSPMFESYAVEADTIRVKFREARGGLKTRDGESVTGFVIAGVDRQFHPAEATIDGDSVVVRSNKVPNPLAARYAWANNPTCNLYNDAGLPAAPLRTDDWPGVTDMRR